MEQDHHGPDPIQARVVGNAKTRDPRNFDFKLVTRQMGPVPECQINGKQEREQANADRGPLDRADFLAGHEQENNRSGERQ